MTDYLVYDVFTDNAFGGNQLAIIPDATALPEDDLQRIAREFNYSESTFVYPPSDPSNTARVRIFTPTMEIAFAGHPTIGTAIALGQMRKQSALTLELGVGPIPCTVAGDQASFTTAAPLERLATPAPTLLARVLGLAESQIKVTNHAPVQASLGLPFVLVELTDRASLTDASPVLDDMRKAAALHPAGLDFATFAYCRNDNHVDARMFAPLDNIPEDPATGSAAATLAALLAENEGAPVTLNIHQGDDMERPSRIFAQTLEGTPVPVKITGQAVQTMQGKLVY